MKTDPNKRTIVAMPRAATKKKIFEGSEWLTIEDISRFQKDPTLSKPSVSEWKRCGRVFSILYEGKDYYARYQFDSLCQPLPIIKAVLDAYGEYSDPWAVAAWFHFPNGWIANGGSAAMPMSPKDALSRGPEIVNAALRRNGTYFA